MKFSMLIIGVVLLIWQFTRWARNLPPLFDEFHSREAFLHRYGRTYDE